jgi:hypothetical protein
MQICFHITRLVSIISDCCYVASNGQLELLQQYFSANKQYFRLTANQHKPNFSEANREQQDCERQAVPITSSTNH